MSNAIAGISGGRTSAMMAYDLPAHVVLAFQNTGREAAGTLDFLVRLEDEIERPILRMEYRAPARGEPPVASTFEVVSHTALARRGEPFTDLLECIRTYRAKHKGLGPVAPWARSRICTAYLKIRTQRKWCAAQGWGTFREYDEYVGLRADEPERVARMRERNDKLHSNEYAPLHRAGITKADVLAFWRAQPFDLQVPGHMGNCTGCFLKDEADLATALLDPETDAAWWIDAQTRYAPMRRGRPGYAQVLAEAPDRMRIRAGIRTGSAYEVSLPERRIRLIVKQELAARASFSCACDGSKGDESDDELLAEIE